MYMMLRAEYLLIRLFLKGLRRWCKPRECEAFGKVSFRLFSGTRRMQDFLSLRMNLRRRMEVRVLVSWSVLND